MAASATSHSRGYVELPALSDGTSMDALDAAFRRSMSHLPTEGLIVVLFSGGVDSGTIAWELRERTDTRLATLGLQGASDLLAAGVAANLVGLPWTPCPVEPSEVRTMADRLETWLGPAPRAERSIDVALGLAIERAPPGTVVCGQGADELFFGYAHFRGLDLPAAEMRSESDLAVLRERAWPRTLEVARQLGRRLVAPYLDEEFVAAARAIPVATRRADGSPKAWFRRWGQRRGVPDAIALRPKKALQYGTGVDRLLRISDANP